MSDKKINERMCLIYDVSIPGQVRRFQATRVRDCTSEGERLDLDSDNNDIEKTPIFSLFTAILEQSADSPIRDTSKPEVRKLVRDQTRRFIKAFLMRQVDTKFPEIPLQPRISMTLPAPPAGGLMVLDPSIEVTGWERALPDLFGIAGTRTTWGQITAAFALPSGANALWIDDIEEDLNRLTTDKIPAQTDVLCHAKNGYFFRPVVTRYFPYVSGRREVFITFIQVPRRSLLPKEAGRATAGILSKQHVLLIALLFGFRFKSEKDLKSTLLRIEREIVILENEAEEFGFDSADDQTDHPAINDSISNETDRSTIVGVTKKWESIRQRLVRLLSDLRNRATDTSAADVSTEVLTGLTDMKEPNKQFMEIVIRELILSQGLKVGDVPAAVDGASSTAPLAPVPPENSI